MTALRRLLLTMLLSSLPAVAALAEDAELDADNLFPVFGTDVEFTIGGPPNASYVLRGARLPAEVPFGAEGTMFLDSESARVLATGRLAADGRGVATVTIPANPDLVGTFFYFQARVVADGVGALSRALPVRVEAAVPSGARNPVALTATADGGKLYIAHQRDGSISVLDPATDEVVHEFPAVPAAGAFRQVPLDLAVDPENRHLFVVHPDADFLTVIDVATDSIVARVPVPRGSQAIAFDFGLERRRIYVTNDRDDAVLVLEEPVDGGFVELAGIPLEGLDPRPIAVMPDGRLLVGQRTTLEVEVVDPELVDGSATVARVPLDAVPFDIELVDAVALVTQFSLRNDRSPRAGNEVSRIDLGGFVVLDEVLGNLGTDYLSIAAAEPFFAVAAAGSGTLIVADAETGTALDSVVLAPGSGPELVPTAVPQEVVFLPAADGGAPERLYGLNYFRESVRPVSLVGGPPYALDPEVPLAYSGSVRVPLQDLTPAEDGDWFYRSVVFFGGTAEQPNPVSCFSCHDLGPGNRLRTLQGVQIPQTFAPLDTAPWGRGGDLEDLGEAILETGRNLSISGAEPPEGGTERILDFLEDGLPPAPSPFLLADGSLSAEAIAGRELFDGVAQCADCHSAPLFIPTDPALLTLDEGVGTGLAPANVPSLRAIWNSAPYLHDGSAATLLDVLLQNTADEHGVTSSLSETELDRLVAYLRSL